jgi:hypothetical protein
MTKQAQSNPDRQPMKTISVGSLKDKLNSFYSQAKMLNRPHGQSEHFDYLWDLKEMALIEGKDSIEVPEEWLLELDQLQSVNATSH